MRLAVFADIHANRQAFSACLDCARGARRGADHLPRRLSSDMAPIRNGRSMTVMDLVERGAIAVRGNHDNAIGTPAETMNAEAQAAIEWTRGRLSAAQRRFWRSCR